MAEPDTIVPTNPADRPVKTEERRALRKLGWDAFWGSQTAAVLSVIVVILIVWYLAAISMNSTLQRDANERADVTMTTGEFVSATLNQKRPRLPAPHQIAIEIWETTAEKKITSKRSLIYHSWVTLSSTLVGFAIGSVLGIILATAIVHSLSLNKSLMPWIIASQTIPILAIAPMIVVVLGAMGLTGLLPKAVISTYLSFFPVTVGMVKGLRSPDPMHLDLMRTYSANGWQTYWKLRWPTALPYLFTSMKIAIAISLVGAIVGELPTGAVAGLGARLLAGSYYGQTVQIWSALIMASFLAATLVTLVGLIDTAVRKRMGQTS